jgi:hypothetical protein
MLRATWKILVFHFLLLTLTILLFDLSLPPLGPIENPPEEAWLYLPISKTPGEPDVLEANWVAGVLKVGVDGELLGKPNGEVAGEGDPFLSITMFPPFICTVGSPNIGVVGDGFGLEGVADVNENTALGIELNGDVAGPVFGEPYESEAGVVNLLANTGCAENAGLELKAKDELVAGEDGGAVLAPEPAAQENREFEFEGLEHIVAEPTGESAKLCELPEFKFSEDLELKLFPGLCVNRELQFSDCTLWFPEKNVGSGESALDISSEAELTVSNFWGKPKGVLLSTALDLSCTVEEPAMPNCCMELKLILLFAASDLRWAAGELAVWTGGKPKEAPGLAVQDNAKDFAANIFEVADKLPKRVLEKVKLPPVEQLCVMFEVKLVEMVEEPALWNETEPVDVL